MPTLYEGTCEQCRAEYRGYGKRFCSDNCRCQAHRRRVARACEQCGVTFERPQSAANHYGTRFCSTACFHEWERRHPELYRNRVQRLCEECGKEFEVVASRADARFCNRKCAGKWHNRRLRAFIDGLPTGERAALYARIRGANSPHWRGGWPSDYGPEWPKMRDRARERDGYHCCGCGRPEETSKRHHVHHKKPFREVRVHELENLITLCPSCHNRVEGRRKRKRGDADAD